MKVFRIIAATPDEMGTIPRPSDTAEAIANARKPAPATRAERDQQVIDYLKQQIKGV